MLGTGAHLNCTGKGRKQRATPLTTDTAKVLRAWMNECPDQPNDPLFPGPRGGPLSRDAISRIVARHATTATRTTDIYQHADLSIKERALARTAPSQPRTPRSRYRPPDDLLAFLETL